MNEPTPLTPESVDALLSADLDGDFEAAARDLGFDASEARARLDTSPGVDARRTALAHARDLIASRPQVEASVEDRLIAAALAGDGLAATRARSGRRERPWRVLVATGSVAAAIAVIVGIASMSTTSPSNSKAASVGTPTTRHPNAEIEKNGSGVTTPGTRLYFGDVSDAQSLRVPARRLLAKAATTFDGNNVVSPSTAPSAPLPDTVNRTTTAADQLYATSAAPACTITKLQRANVPTRPALIASGTVAGNVPVVILIYAGPPSPYAYVIRVSDCSLVRKQPLG